MDVQPNGDLWDRIKNENDWQGSKEDFEAVFGPILNLVPIQPEEAAVSTYTEIVPPRKRKGRQKA